MKKEIVISNPNGLPTLEYTKFRELQGDLKTLNNENKEKLKNSILKYGFRFPVFAWKDADTFFIIDAHQRMKALKSLEEESYIIPELPYILVESKTKKEAAELLLQANSRYGQYNPETTFFEDFNIDLSFIEHIEIPELDIKLDELEQSEIEEDEVPEPPAEPLSKTGDLWILGNRHRVLCGDATQKADIGRLMKNEKANICFCDPPYGVSYSDKNTFLNAIDKGNLLQDKIEGDAYQQDNTEEIWLSAFQNIKATLADDASFYICSAQGGELQMMMMMMKKAELNFRHMLVWVKNNHVLGRSDYNYKHEPILYGWNKKHTFYGKGDQKTSVWQYDKPHKSDLHPVMKPVGLVANALLNSSKEGDICIDFFLGSGTTLISCAMLNRTLYGCEIVPHYVDIAIIRWINWMLKEGKEDEMKILRNGKEFDYTIFL